MDSVLQETNPIGKINKKVKGGWPNGYIPELDDTPECGIEKIRYYQHLIGVLQWTVEIGRIDLIPEANGWRCRAENIEGKNGAILTSLWEKGTNPSTAVEKFWDTCMEYDMLVVGAYTKDRRQYRWNEFMWVEIK